MVRLSDAQIAGAAKGAGFTGDALVTAVAVALAESSGNPRNHNRIPPDNSYGLWQINMIDLPGYMLGAERRRRFNLKSNEDLFNPQTNARVAYAISNGGKNWKDWSTYTNLAYRQFLGRARLAAGAPAPAPGGGGGTSPVSTGGGSVVPVDWTPDGSGTVTIGLEDWLPDPLGILPGESGPLGLGMLAQWTAALVKAGAWLSESHNWVRVAQVVAGAGLLIAGVTVVAKPAIQAGASAAGKVAAVTPVGRGAKVAAAAGAAKSAA